MQRFLLLASMALATACGGGAGGGSTTVSAQYEGPVRSTDTEHGGQVFNTICMACHSGHPLNDLGWTAGRVRQQVREGSGRMTALSAERLSDDDLEAVIAYMTTIGAVSDALPGAGAETSGAETGGAETSGAETGGAETPVEPAGEGG